MLLAAGFSVQDTYHITIMFITVYLVVDCGRILSITQISNWKKIHDDNKYTIIMNCH